MVVDVFISPPFKKTWFFVLFYFRTQIIDTVDVIVHSVDTVIVHTIDTVIHSVDTVIVHSIDVIVHSVDVIVNCVDVIDTVNLIHVQIINQICIIIKRNFSICFF